MIDDNGDDTHPGFRIKTVPFAEISILIKRGGETVIDPADLANEIRKYGAKNMPAEVSDYLCRYLEGSIETRGRKGSTELERRFYGRYVKMLYSHIRKAQRGDETAEPDAVAFYRLYIDGIDDSFMPSEIAWRIVSIWMYDHDGHHKKLRNIAGLAK